MERGGTRLIVGLGATGLSCARHFAARGVDFKVTDTREAPPGLAELARLAPGVDCELGGFRRRSFLEAGELVVSPGVSLKTPEIAAARAAGVPVTGDIDIFSRRARAPIVAVTGSNGKSTVVAMLADILARAGKRVGVGGNLDVAGALPALGLLEQGERDLYLLELSSFQLETTRRLGARVAALLNLSAAHMDRYDGIGEYHRAKLAVFNGCRRAVVNRNDPLSRPPAGSGVPVLDYGFGRPGAGGLGLLEEGGDQYLARRFEKIMSVSELKVFGQHNVLNALAAIACAEALGVGREPARQALRDFSGLPHRCQWVGDVAGVAFYNDSKGTSVGATLASVEGLGQRIDGHILLIAGGVSRGADLRELVPAINRWGKEIILIGREARDMAARLDADVRARIAADMQDAVGVALRHAAPGDAVLLSPACASFDMFDNYRHRGQTFIRSVERLR